MYEEILVAFDGSETSDRALAEPLHVARLTCAHAIDIMAPFGRARACMPAALIAAYRERARTVVPESARSEAKARGADRETACPVLLVRGAS
ncbi:universal stress protein [Paraburkholderia lycopersici]|uniref:Universal stress protein family protein n=1 Tax=Paraburkholderia lycopersici TaxID=416944 RepID=A0A1G6Q5S9_9BURK|nr:universal stress protein [Paraburkholderia lycopersici]SDC87812.1 Universal stress protein family protein [Paraburkholderia lycopersici]